VDLELAGRAAVVTGASRGIGLSVARALAAEGCRLGLCARGAAGLERAAQELRAGGAQVAAAPADVREAGQAARFVEQCAAELGGIDILINNVGGSAGGGLMQAGDEHWRETFDQALVQAVRLIRLAAPHLRRRGGAVINIASISGWRPQLGGVAQYGAAKAAMIFMTERLALELAADGVRVNTFSPGSTMVEGGYWDRIRQSHPAEFEAYAREGFPMGRMGRPEDIAAVVAFLASPRANWINGRHIPVDGLQQPVAWNAPDRRG
jgi:3-oxoacyl-[acyl-carrier protein] reductase